MPEFLERYESICVKGKVTFQSFKAEMGEGPKGRDQNRGGTNRTLAQEELEVY